MFHLPFSTAFKSAVLVLEAQQVIALRMLRLANGGRKAQRELERMFVEKAEAAVEVAIASVAAMLSGQSPSAVADRTISDYGGRIRKNRRRLS
jgi:hypothetical protein